jgi:hypothetical protein
MDAEIKNRETERLLACYLSSFINTSTTLSPMRGD